MTAALIERMARLMQETFLEEWRKRHPDSDWQPLTFDERTEESRHYLRAAARAVLRALGR